MMFGWDPAGSSAGLMLAAMAVMAVVIVVSVGLIVRRPGAPSTTGADANDILRERFARGEITKEQYEDAKRTLG
jgi:uncharacterized membrane protein